MSSERPWDEYYARTAHLPGPERTQYFLNHIAANGRILDAGCCTGRWSAAFLRDRPDLTIDLFDSHPESAGLIPDPWPGERYVQSFESFRLRQRYDGIWAHASLFFVPPAAQEAVFQNLCDALHPGGIFCLDMVAPCEAAQANQLHAIEEAALRQRLERFGMRVDKLRTKDVAYGTEQMPIPTHFVTASRIG